MAVSRLMAMAMFAAVLCACGGRVFMTPDTHGAQTLAVRDALVAASHGLLMPSESDRPFEPVLWAKAAAGFDANALRARLRLPASAPIEEITLDDFFAKVATAQPWHDAQQQADVPRFAALRDTLRQRMQDVRVYRVGAIELHVYIVGRSGDDIVGLTTVLIET
jgi:hypothetical protein